MKKTLRSISFLLAGMLILSACTEKKPGKAPDKITQKIDVQPQEIVNDTIPPDSTIIKVIPKIPPPPPYDPFIDPLPEPPIPEPEPEPVPPPPIPTDEIVEFPDVQPEYVGGELEMKKFIVDNMVYPQMEIDAGIQGRVFVQFIVEKDGSLSEVQLLRPISKNLDEEALRVVRMMPNWKPGEANGKIVRSRMRLPISFTLQ